MIKPNLAALIGHIELRDAHRVDDYDIAVIVVACGRGTRRSGRYFAACMMTYSRRPKP